MIFDETKIVGNPLVAMIAGDPLANVGSGNDIAIWSVNTDILTVDLWNARV